jgi:hypothetical protein
VTVFSLACSQHFIGNLAEASPGVLKLAADQLRQFTTNAALRSCEGQATPLPSKYGGC